MNYRTTRATAVSVLLALLLGSGGVNADNKKGDRPAGHHESG